MIVEDGLVVDAWGAIAKKILIHSIRKSYLSALYGIYVNQGIIHLSKTLARLGLDDNVPRLSASEKTATIEDLLKARSGVYHPGLEETASMENKRPERDSHPPGVTMDEGAFAAEGVGGNYIVVIPSRKLVVVNRVDTAARHGVKKEEFGRLMALILEAKIEK